MWGFCVITLTLGSRPRQGLARLRAKKASPKVKESVREWTLTLPKELPPWELESRWTLECSESNYRGQNSMDWKVLYNIGKILKLRCLKWSHITHLHYNNRGLFCDPNIIANNKERNFQNPAVTNHNSSQTLNLLRYHNIRTRTIASPSQLPNLIKSQTFPIITVFIHCLQLTLYRKLFATNPSPQRLNEPTQKSIGFRYKI
jgi:hypothetical protein